MSPAAVQATEPSGGTALDAPLPCIADAASVRCHHLAAADGGRCALWQVGAAVGTPHPPVVMHAGLFTGREFWLSDRGVGLAAWLAEAGFSCWIVERRGIAASGTGRTPRAAMLGLDAHLRHDLPLVQAHVARHDPRPAFWLGHSFGGVMATRAVAEVLPSDSVAGLVLLATQLDSALRSLRPPASWLLRGLTTVTGRLPARRLGLGRHDEPHAAMVDATRWVRAARRNADWTDALATVQAPLLALAGAADRADPPDGCRRFIERMASPDRLFFTVGRAEGFTRDLDHVGLVISREARREVWPLVAEWMIGRAAPEADPKPFTQ